MLTRRRKEARERRKKEVRERRRREARSKSSQSKLPQNQLRLRRKLRIQ